MTNNIIFRNKFEKVVNEQNKEAFQKAFQLFGGLTPDKAAWQLWRLGITIKEINDGADKATQYATQFLSCLELNNEHVKLENLELLRSELRYQYEQENPNFLKVKSWNEACFSAYQELKNKTDSIIAYIVYNHCVERVYFVGMEKVLYLLSCDEEKNYFGGIRSLNFGWLEAKYLKPFHKHIYELLKAMHEYKVQKEAEEEKNNPFAKLSGMFAEEVAEEPTNEEIQKAEDEPAVSETEEQQVANTVGEEVLVEEPPKTTAEEHEVQIHAYVPLTVEIVLEHQELFWKFLKSDMNVLLEIGKLGLDLNEVMAKKEKISALLMAIKAFSYPPFNGM